MIHYIIKTDKGYICEANAKGTYSANNSEFYRAETGKWFSTLNAGMSDVDKLGFTDDKEKATMYSGCIGNRIQEIADRIKFGFEKFTFICIEPIYDINDNERVWRP